jgi:hypothetical protein
VDDVLIMLAVGAGLLVINFAFKAVLYRVKKGKFRIVTSSRDGGATGFETDYGRFILSPSKHALYSSGTSGSKLKFSLTRIRGVAFDYADEVSWLGEFVFGLDLWDLLFSSSRDSVQWQNLALEIEGGTALPVFIAGQYARREIFLNWWFTFERDLLQRIGVLQPIDDRVQEVRGQIERMLRDVGALKKHSS